MRLKQSISILILAVLLLIPGTTEAQQAGTITGLVRDSTGGVIPGATVEASSPALIEKVRSVVTDADGQYRLADLRPGAYTVTFTLPGFSTFKREGIELTAGFTATVNAELRVGDVAETIVVSGQSPVVDVNNVTQSRVMTRDILDAIPSGKRFNSFAALIPGLVVTNQLGSINQDVGGMTGMDFQQTAIHGGRTNDQSPNINGMSVMSLTGAGTSRMDFHDNAVEEYVMQVASHAAEFPTGGVYVNVLPKEGGNALRGSFFTSFTNESLQASNIDDDLRQRGLSLPALNKRLVDVSPSAGGRIIRDRLWFYAAFRYQITDSYVGGLYYNKDPKAWVYTPDLSRPAVNDQNGKDASVNLTWQASPRNKFTGYYANSSTRFAHASIKGSTGAFRSPEAALDIKNKPVIYQGTWFSPVTSRLLLEAGVSHFTDKFPRDPEPDASEPSITEQSTGLQFRSTVPYLRNDQTVDHYRAALSYVTGSHALKVGFSLIRAFGPDLTYAIGDVSYRTLNGTPNQATYYATPYTNPFHIAPFALYAQDQWRLKRVTLNLGLRFDQFRSSYEAVHVDAVRWLPVERDYPGADVQNWKDISPRLGVSYDIFGTGKTALKASVGRYVLQQEKTQVVALHPVVAATNTISRTWTDLNGDFIVQADPLNPALNGELGPSPNFNFGKPITTLRFDPTWVSGWRQAPFNWETSVAIQHEILPRVAVSAAYFRRIFGNFIVDNNVLAGPNDYDPYCITTPVDARLPGGGGREICGLYDIKPARLSLVDQVRTSSARYGNQYEHWNGGDFTLNAHLQRGVLLQGGLSTGKTMTDNCDIVTKINNPSQLYCHQESAFLTQVKFLGTYPLPWWGLQLNATFQSLLPSPTGASSNPFGMRADFVATNALIAPSLGRNLAAGANANATINVIEPGSVYGVRSNQVDLRIAKTFTFGKARLQALLDLYNLLNANPIFQYNNTYGTNGTSWFVPQTVLPGRLIRFGGQIHF